MDLDTARAFGGVGAILSAVGMIPVIGINSLLTIIGAILLLVALKVLADHYGKDSIFTDALVATILGIIGPVILIVAMFVIGMPFSVFGAPPTILTLGALIVVYLIAVLSSWLFKRALYDLSNVSGEGLFRLAGLLLFIGAILLIALGIGVFIMFIAMIILAIAFFTFKERRER